MHGGMSPGKGPDVCAHLPEPPATQAEPLSRIQSKHLHSEAPLYLCWASGSTVNIWEATRGQFLLTFTEKWLVKQ